MPRKTIDELKNLEFGDDARFTAYKNDRHLIPPTPAELPSLLVLIRQVQGLTSAHGNTRLRNRFVEEIGSNASKLSRVGVDFVDGQTRDLYANISAEDFVNETDAAILRAILCEELNKDWSNTDAGIQTDDAFQGFGASLAAQLPPKAQGGQQLPASGSSQTSGGRGRGLGLGRGVVAKKHAPLSYATAATKPSSQTSSLSFGPAPGGQPTPINLASAGNNGEWIRAKLTEHLGFDYTTIFGNAEETLNEALRWASCHITTRFRHQSQVVKWLPTVNTMDQSAGLIRLASQANRELHDGLFIRDARFTLAGGMRFDADPSDPKLIPMAEKSRRKNEHQWLFEMGYGMSVKDAMRLDAAVTRRDAVSNSANLADIFLWLTEYIDNFFRWSNLVAYDWSLSRVSGNAKVVMGPIRGTYLAVVRDILILLQQRETFRGVTEFMWGRVQRRCNNLSALVRAYESVPTATGEPHITEFGVWRDLYNGLHPRDSFPAVRDPPDLADDAKTFNVPAHLDGGGPDNRGGRGGRGGGGGRDGRGRRGGRGRGGGGGDSGGGSGGGGGVPATYGNPTHSFDFGDMDLDTNPAPSAWSHGQQPSRTQVSDVVWMCDRCAHIFTGPLCPKCTEGTDDSILTPNQRLQVVLDALGVIDNTRDNARKVQEDLMEWEGSPIEMAHFPAPASLQQRLPEFGVRPDTGIQVA